MDFYMPNDAGTISTLRLDSSNTCDADETTKVKREVREVPS
jgi:hypothetical protein